MLSRLHLRRMILPFFTLALLGFVFLGDSPAAKPKSIHHPNWSDIYLGVYTQSVDKELATSFKLTVDRGAIVNDVEPDSPAEKAGIKEDDVITSLNGHEIYDEDDLVDEVQSFDSGDRVKIGLVRDGKVMVVEAEVEERDFDSMASLRGLAGLDKLRGLAGPRIATPGGRAPRAFAWNGDQIRELDNEGYIGISYSDLTTQLATYFGVTGSGALVTQVIKSTPAEKAGLKAGDVVTKVDDESISRRSSLSDLIGDFHAGDTARLTIIRDKRSMTVSVVVEEREDDDDLGFFPGSIDIAPRASGRQREMARRELEAALKDAHRMRGMRYGDDRDVANSDELQARIKELESQLDELRGEMKELRK